VRSGYSCDFDIRKKGAVLMSVCKQAADHNELRDIRDVHIDTSLPKEARIRDFLRQIDNPYYFRHGKYVVTVSFVQTDITLEDRLAAYVRSKM